MSDLIQLKESLYMFDLFEQGQVGRSSAYLYNGPKKTLIETGSANSLDHILDSLKRLDLTPEDLDYVIVTHVHLDHAGGAGKLAELAKKATFVAHPRAARHLIDPTRLIQGAAQVYGDAMHSLFGDILPIPEQQVLIREDGETIDIGDRKLVFLDTPGHAKHHFFSRGWAKVGVVDCFRIQVSYFVDCRGNSFRIKVCRTGRRKHKFKIPSGKRFHITNTERIT